jgi:hypothetical protein
LNGKQNIILGFAGIILCLILFAAGMLYAEQTPWFVLAGILGLGGIGYSVFRIVKRL